MRDELDIIAENYHLNNKVDDMFIEEICQRYEFEWVKKFITTPNLNILDLGYGDGVYFEELNKLGNVVLVEGSKKLSDKAQNLIKEKNLKAEVINKYFEEFKPNKRFSYVIASHVLEHVENPNELLLQIKGWLEPNGKLIIIVPNAESIHRRLGLELGLQNRLDELSERDKIVGHKRVYSLNSIIDDLKSCGYTIQENRGFFLKSFSNSQLMNFDASIIQSLCKISVKINPEYCANLGLLVTIEK